MLSILGNKYFKNGFYCDFVGIAPNIVEGILGICGSNDAAALRDSWIINALDEQGSGKN